jgi:hypothetical protein
MLWPYTSRGWRCRFGAVYCLVLRRCLQVQAVRASENLKTFNTTEVKRWRSWLRRYATSRKVVVSIPDKVIEFLSIYLVWQKWVPEFYLRGKERPVYKSTSSLSLSRFSRKYGIFGVLQPYRDIFTFLFNAVATITKHWATFQDKSILYTVIQQGQFLIMPSF